MDFTSYIMPIILSIMLSMAAGFGNIMKRFSFDSTLAIFSLNVCFIVMVFNGILPIYFIGATFVIAVVVIYLRRH